MASSDANQMDFFGEGTAAPVQAGGQLTPEQLADLRARQNALRVAQDAAQTSAINNAPGGYASQRAASDRDALTASNAHVVADRIARTGSAAGNQHGFLGNLVRDPVTMGILAAPLAVTGAGLAVGGAGALGFGAGTGSIATPAGAPAIYGAASAAPAASAPFTMASPYAAGTAGSTLGAAAGAAGAAGGMTASQALGAVGGAGAIAAGLAGGTPKVSAPQVGANFAGGAPGGGGGGGSAAGSQSPGFIADLRDRAAQDMFSYGDSAQGRAAPQTGSVAYRPPTKVNAPTLAPAAQAQMGNYGSAQTINAAQTTAQQAQNQAGFLSGTAQSARNVADLDFGQSNESRGAQQANLSRIGGFLDSGPGPSMAQQQLRMAQQSNLGDALALARSGRGNAAGNMKMALSENAATNAQTNQQASLLRAQEADMWQQRQLQGMGLEQQGATSMRGQDLGAAQAQGQQALSREQLAANVDVSRAGLEQGLSQFNAGQANQVGMSNAQLSTQAGIEQAGLANALNIARGNAGTNVNLSNAEQTNLTNRLQGQMGLDASSTNAQLSNALNIAQGNSDTSIQQANLQAKLDQGRANDAFTNAMYGYGMNAYDQQLQAAGMGLNDQYRYQDLAAEIAMRDADRKAGISTANADRAGRRDAALIGGGASVLASLF